jgi:hypothetical protein
MHELSTLAHGNILLWVQFLFYDMLCYVIDILSVVVWGVGSEWFEYKGLGWDGMR